MGLTADQIRTMLRMQPHPTCGYFAPSYNNEQQFDGSGRPLGTAIYFLVVADRQNIMHRVVSDQIYHHYLGDPLEVLLLYPDGRGERTLVGPDLAAGMRPQLLVPAHTFHVSRVRPGGQFALLGSTAWPGVQPADLEAGDRAALQVAFPNWRDQIAEFMA